MPDNLILLSDVIIHNPQLTNFNELLAFLGTLGEEKPVMLQIDLKPDYRDTPRNWESRLEAAFSWGAA